MYVSKVYRLTYTVLIPMQMYEVLSVSGLWQCEAISLRILLFIFFYTMFEIVLNCSARKKKVLDLWLDYSVLIKSTSIV